MNIEQVDQWCSTLFTNSESKETLADIREKLGTFNRVEMLPQIRSLMESSRNTYTHFFCAQMLNTLVTEGWNGIPLNEKILLRDWVSGVVLNPSHRTTYEKYVATSLIQCLARITKFGWLDIDECTRMPEKIGEVMVRGAPDAASCVLGLRVLQMVVIEVNVMQAKRPVAQHRKTSHAFRDCALLPIFTVAIETLARRSDSSDAVEAAVSLCASCLNYDFAGLFMEDLGDDTGHTQIPSPWRVVLMEYNVLSMMWGVYTTTQQTDALRCLTLLGSVRRTFFANDEERKRWLEEFMGGIVKVIRGNIGVEESDNYHEICRMHSKLKSTYQLVDLIACRFYDEWLRLMADFTFMSLTHWQNTYNSQQTLLTFWARIASSHPYAPNNPNSGDPNSRSILPKVIPDIARAFLAMCLDMSETVERQPQLYDNPLADSETLLVHLEPIPPLMRHSYIVLGTHLAECGEHIMIELMNTPPGPGRDVIYAKLTWLVYISSVVVRSANSNGASNIDSEWKDGDLTTVVLRLVQMMMNDTQDRTQARIRFELSLLHFLQSFRIVHIGDNSGVGQQTKVHMRIAELMGQDFQDLFHVLEFIAQKIIFNMRYWWNDIMLMEESLKLFIDLANGFNSGRQLLELQTVQHLCQTHCNNTTGFDFLTAFQTTKHRTKYYRALTMLFFMDSCSEEAFVSFIQPVKYSMEIVREDVGRALSNGDVLQHQTCRLTVVVGALRDLRGVCLACTSKKTFSVFFDWLFGSYLGGILELAQVCYSQPDIATSIIKFFAELTFNRQQRIQFDSNSPCGILLFKRASAFVQIISRHYCTAWPHIRSVEHLLVMNKHLTYCIYILQRLLVGNYCNFGVFSVYDDTTLTDIMEAVFRMLDCGLGADLFQYPKLSLAYFAMLDVLCTVQCRQLCEMNTQRFMNIIHSLEAALQYPGNARGVVAHAANALHYLASFIHLQITRKSPILDIISSHMATDSTVFVRIMECAVHTVLYDETANLWNMSRPLLPLIFICQDAFDTLRLRFIESVSSERRAQMESAFECLMEKIDHNLEPKNKDKFTQNITMFKHSMKTLI